MTVGVLFVTVSPLTLSFSPWERGPLNYPQRKFWRPFSHGEKDRMRGGAPGAGALPQVIS